MPSYSDHRSARTSVINFFRNLLRWPAAETVLMAPTTDGLLKDLAKRIIPPEYLYGENAVRQIGRDGIKYELHMNDMMDHQFYFRIDKPHWDGFLKLIKSDFIVFDIGAKNGLMTMPLALKAAHVHSYEPSQKNFTRLARHIALNALTNVSLHRSGIGDGHQKVKLYQAELYNLGMNRIMNAPDQATECEEIEINTLDGEMDEMELTRVDAIKIDVEGYEMNVLLGADKTISHFRPVLFIELIQKTLALYGHSPVQVIDFVKQKGYHCFDAKTLREMTTPLDRVETDIICLHKTSAQLAEFYHRAS